jgi:hypothetical protein
VHIAFSNETVAQQQNPTLSIPDEVKITELINIIEDSTDYYFTYNTELTKGAPVFRFDKSPLSLSKILQNLDEYYPYQISIDENTQKIQLVKDSKFRIKGVVIDSFSGETIQDVQIYCSTVYNTNTNEDGYFSMMIDTSIRNIIVSQIGYQLREISVNDLIGTNSTIPLSFNQTFLDITILDTPLKQEKFKQSQKHTHQDISSSSSISGTPDLLSYLKVLPSVSSGSEGQTGFNVRGGGSEQNLVLLDGFPIYEVSHLGGLSSVFLTDAVKNIDFYSSGFPARYDGALSSVVDVRLKEGNRNKFSRKLSIGLEGIQGQFEGPIGPSTSINITGKKSLITEIIRPILKNRVDLIDARLGYFDLYGKLTHWFSPSNRISAFAYIGSDNIGIEREIRNNNDLVNDINRIEWGNKVYGIQWNRTLMDNFFLTMSAGYTQYRYNSTGSYQIQFFNNGNIQTNSFTLLSESFLEDYSIKSSIDYYSDNLGKFKIGFNYIDHTNAPFTFEEEVFLVGTEEINVVDSIYKTEEFSAYIENELSLGSNVNLNTGLRYNQYNTEGTSYVHLNPRLNITYSRRNYSLSASYSRLSQFIHLLTNPGPGLPSSLWAPSTDELGPERSDNFDLSYKYRKGNFSFGSSIYYKKFNSVIEYQDPNDIIYSFIINDNSDQVVNNADFEERSIVGTGTAYGIEFNSELLLDKWSLLGTYTLSRSIREFDEIDGGEPFPFRFDRTHDISVSIKYQFKKNQYFKMNFVYGTGNAITLLTEEILRPENQPPLPIAPSRNNFRVPDNHHLDISYNIEKRKDDKIFEASVGVYNVYNQLNPFYVFILENSEANASLRSISIYPILPQLNFSYRW